MNQMTKGQLRSIRKAHKRYYTLFIRGFDEIRVEYFNHDLQRRIWFIIDSNEYKKSLEGILVNKKYKQLY